MSVLTRGPLAFVLAVGLVASACGGSTGDDGQGAISVVASTSLWADVVESVACDPAVEVPTVVPGGGDPHAYEPSLADRRDLEQASLVVVNGLGLEEGLEDTLAAVARTGVDVFSVGEHVDVLPYSTAADGDDHDHAADPSSADPHLWFDPIRVAGVIPDLVDALVAAGLDPERTRGCGADYVERLEEVHRGILASVETLEPARRRLVTNHDSLGYFADRYGFVVVGTVLPAPSGLAAANPGQLEDLARLIEAEGVPAVFAEVEKSTADAEALADRLPGVRVVTLRTGGLGPPGSATESYLGFLEATAAAVVGALADPVVGGD
jgi:zinc/manganese transport system substrate-binding protein